jgi:hypothetical protein
LKPGAQLEPASIGAVAQCPPTQLPVVQSAFTTHVSPSAHGGQVGPPQSTSVSAPSFTPSVHVATVG